MPWVMDAEAVRPSTVPSTITESIDLVGVVLLDTVAERPGAERGPALLVLIRHRY